jgi:hypothetical protein
VPLSALVKVDTIPPAKVERINIPCAENDALSARGCQACRRIRAWMPGLGDHWDLALVRWLQSSSPTVERLRVSRIYRKGRIQCT